MCRLRQHESLTLALANDQSVFYGCDKHKEREIEFYCRSDRVLVCGICAGEEREVEFYCRSDRVLMCGICAGDHMDHLESLLPYPWTSLKKDAAVLRGIPAGMEEDEEDDEDGHDEYEWTAEQEVCYLLGNFRAFRI
jgi:hypothetical protein